MTHVTLPPCLACCSSHPLVAAALLRLAPPTTADAAAAAAAGGAAGVLHTSARPAKQQQALNRVAGDPPGCRPRMYCSAMPWVQLADVW